MTYVKKPTDKNLLNRVRQKLSKATKTIKQLSINNFLTELTPDSITEYSLWKTTKYLKRPIAQVPPTKRTDGKWARNNLENISIARARVVKPSSEMADIHKLIIIFITVSGLYEL
jgi:hypothetical protein